MSTQTQEKPAKTWFSRLLKVFIFFAIFLAIIFTVLANMGGSGEMYRTAVEDFLSESTGYKARVGKLNNMTFFPVIAFDFEDAVLLAEDGTDIPLATIDKVHMSLGFWDMTMQSGRLRSVEVRGVSAMPGVFIPQAFNLESLTIDTLSDEEAQLLVQGHIGPTPFDFNMDMRRHGHGHNAFYSFAKERPFALNIGEISVQGISRDKKSGVAFEDVHIALYAQVIATGTLAVSDSLSGSFTVAEHGSVMNFNGDIVHEGESVTMTGKIDSPEFFPADFTRGSRAVHFLTYLASVLNEEEDEHSDDFSFIDADLSLTLENIHAESPVASPLEFSLQLKDGRFHVDENAVQALSPYMNVDFSLDNPSPKEAE